MTVTIQVRYEPDALMAPLQTIFAVQDKQFCLVKTGPDPKDWETREVETDGNNSKFVLIKSGLEEGDQLVMNPGAHRERMDLPDLKLDTKIDIPDEAKQQYTQTENQNAKTNHVHYCTKPTYADQPVRHRTTIINNHYILSD